ncbi:MAG: signal peptidase I [Alphaproteobacteria bacterium]|nr:signal peptidase I [Alphaproteobacteria bacterium]MBL6776451.1 signal peptidase I [Alphaproteobacteria bacterium]
MKSGDEAQDKSGWLDTIKTLFIAGLIAISFRSVIAEPFNIPSGSMIPTLLVGDYLFVSKFSYGYSRHSFPFSAAPISNRVMASMPERGDVAVFRLPSNVSVDYIKRVVGLPGDRIQVKRGILHINGQAVERRLVGNGNIASGQTSLVTQRYEEVFPDGHTHIIQEVSDNQVFDNTPEFTVPEGHYFMMGDNRDNSRDSRSSSVGFVPFENFIGRAEFLFFSHGGDARFWEVWKWPFSVRISRIFSGIS